MKVSKTNNQNRKSAPRDSFLEAFRDLGSNVGSSVKDDLFKKGASDVLNSFSPFGQPQTPNERPNSNEMFSQEAELEKRLREQYRKSETIRRQEQVLFTSQQKETQRQVNSLQEEIKKLAKATGELANEAKEAQISAMQEAPVRGTYHVNFFIRLRNIIARLRSQIQESSLWLASWNKKAQKKNFYWGQFKKSGSKFSLSADRYSATQAG